MLVEECHELGPKRLDVGIEGQLHRSPQRSSKTRLFS
jgi:hypothetical protein